MSKVSRFFLVVEGKNSGYPSYENATISFLSEDPSTLDIQNPFVNSPLYSVVKEGVDNFPQLVDEVKITFIMMPGIYPVMKDLILELNISNEIWFSIGLANLVVIEEPNKDGLTVKVLQFLESRINITASESWIIRQSKIYTHELHNSKLAYKDVDLEKIDLKINASLPLHLQFAVSEYVIFAKKFLTASKKFTPSYYQNHLKTIEASRLIVNDLAFLHGDFTFIPSDAVMAAFKTDDISIAKIRVCDPQYAQLCEELINDKNGRLIQFNSSMSYVYSQTYSGTFPIFDHVGIVQRHSLLGVGSAISALHELLSQIEGALYCLPFEDLRSSGYFSNYISQHKFFEIFIELSNHDNSRWQNDLVRKQIINNSDPIKTNRKLPSDFFNRLAFFSGRLGFREYDLSATAAIQVLVEANSLQWHVINYTHEIIHNHVRLILNQLILPGLSLRNEEFTNWVVSYLQKYKMCLRAVSSQQMPANVSYIDYFTLVVIQYCINTNLYGSLSLNSNQKLIVEVRTAVQEVVKYKLPTESELSDLMIHIYKDISEIFVHVIDFSYIYKRSLDVYVESIWASWSTVTAVGNDLKQYILRTLVVIAVTENGDINYRYNRAKAKLQALLAKISKRSNPSSIFTRILEILADSSDKDLQYRFKNCIILGDLVYSFFVGSLENYLDNNDQNRYGTPQENENGNQVTYNIEPNSFEGEPILSKVRFLQDQLVREISNQLSTSDEMKERTSAWLLLSLSSHI